MAEKRVNVSFRLTEPLRRLLEYDAREHGISMNQEIINRLQKSLDEDPDGANTNVARALRARGLPWK